MTSREQETQSLLSSEHTPNSDNGAYIIGEEDRYDGDPSLAYISNAPTSASLPSTTASAEQEQQRAQWTNRSRMIAYVATVAMCYDFMATLLTLAPYWAALGGAPHVYGAVLGVYAAARGMGALIFGFLNVRLSHARLLQLCCLLIAIGDVFYFCSSAFLPSLLYPGGSDSAASNSSGMHNASHAATARSSAPVYLSTSMSLGASSSSVAFADGGWNYADSTPHPDSSFLSLYVGSLCESVRV
jgi:MFS family permease